MFMAFFSSICKLVAFCIAVIKKKPWAAHALPFVYYIEHVTFADWKTSAYSGMCVCKPYVIELGLV